MNYTNEFEWGHELANENPELEFENYAGKIWEIARHVHHTPQVAGLKNNYIAAAKAFGRKLVPGGTGSMPGRISGGMPDGAHRRIHFYRKVIRNAANYLNRALQAGHHGHPGSLVKQAFNRASKMVAQTSAPGIVPPRFANTPATAATAGPYQSTTRGVSGTSYTSGPAPAATGVAYHPAARSTAMSTGIRTSTVGVASPAKRGKLWTGSGAIGSGATGKTCSTSSQKQGRWTKKGNLLILHGLSKSTTCS
jgi:hypothetical protein